MLQQNVLAQEEEKTLSPEEVAEKAKIESLEVRAREDVYNINYYPKLYLGNGNLFTGAASLKGNEVFARLGLLNFVQLGNFAENGQASASDTRNIRFTPVVNLGWGIIDSLFFAASVPYGFLISAGNVTNGMGEPWLSLKYQILQEPLMLSVQANTKIPLAATGFGDGQADAGLMTSFTKNLKPFYLQGALGYRYRFPLTTVTTATSQEATVLPAPEGATSVNTNQPVMTTVKYSDELSYVLDIGYMPDFLPGAAINFTTYGNVPVWPTDKKSVLLAIRPNLTYKLKNYDFNLAYDQPLLAYNTEAGFGIQAGFTFKNVFKYPTIFTLLLLPKVDQEHLLNNEEIINQKGREYYVNQCLKCHLLISPSAYNYDQWDTLIDRYRQRKQISNHEKREIMKYMAEYINLQSAKED